MTDLLYKILRDLSEIRREEGRWKTGEGCSFLSPSKGRVMRKMTGKEEGSQKKKNTACILCFTRIQTTYENHDMRLFPDTQFNLHWAATATFWPSQWEFCLLLPLLSSHALSAWYTYLGFISRIRWRKIQSEIEVDAYGPMGSASWLLAGV